MTAATHARHGTRVRPSRPPVRFLAAGLLAAALALTGCGAASEDGAGAKAEPAIAEDAAQEAGSGAEAYDAGAGGRDEAAGDAADTKTTGDTEDTKNTEDTEAAGSADSTAATDHVIRTASLTVRVKDVPKALDAARTATEDAGGFVGEETTHRDGADDAHEETSVVLRVPTDAYEKVLAGIEGTGELVEREAEAEDVTDQVVDVESRITSQRASVARIRELMDRATRLDDVVTLEGELSSRQADLEALLARQASLEDRTSLATITLHLSDAPVQRDGEDSEDGDGAPGFLDALAGGWNAFVTVLRWIVVVLGAALPFAVVAALPVFLWVRFVRPRRHRPEGPTGTPAP